MRDHLRAMWMVMTRSDKDLACAYAALAAFAVLFGHLVVALLALVLVASRFEITERVVACYQIAQGMVEEAVAEVRRENTPEEGSSVSDRSES